MNAEAREKAAELELVLSPHQLFPPSEDEKHRAIDAVLPLIRKKQRGSRPREDQTSIV